MASFVASGTWPKNISLLFKFGDNPERIAKSDNAFFTTSIEPTSALVNTNKSSAKRKCVNWIFSYLLLFIYNCLAKSSVCSYNTHIRFCYNSAFYLVVLMLRKPAGLQLVTTPLSHVALCPDSLSLAVVRINLVVFFQLFLSVIVLLLFLIS